jgi:putative spermidine/putrescine transport system substrate-binding protein
LLTAAVFATLLAGLVSCTPREEKREGPPEMDLMSMEFSRIAESARGGTVRFYMWGGDAKINAWIDDFVVPGLAEKHGIEMVRVPMDASVFVNKLMTEKLAGKEEGVMDLLWINGENFRVAKENGLLFGPFAGKLPWTQACDPDQIGYDFGYPTEGYEAAYGRAQFVFEYDSAEMTDPPETLSELTRWIETNPGRFTYPEPPDFTGSAFLRQIFYLTTGGHEQYMDGFDAELYAEKVPALWAYLRKIRPYLWKEGSTYPKSKGALDLLFERGEVLINMSYHQAAAYGRIIDGRYPATVRTFVLRGASISNVHFTAIPFNSPNKGAAMTAANFLLSPDVQYSKNLPENWGDFTVLDLDQLPEEHRNRFTDIDLGPSTLSIEYLDAHAVPEIPTEYLVRIERDWAGAIFSEG